MRMSDWSSDVCSSDLPRFYTPCHAWIARPARCAGGMPYMAEDSAPAANRAPLLWALAFVLAMFGTAIGARFVGLSGFWTMLFMLPPMLLLIPLVCSPQPHRHLADCTSPRLPRYNRRVLIRAVPFFPPPFL